MHNPALEQTDDRTGAPGRGLLPCPAPRTSRAWWASHARPAVPAPVATATALSDAEPSPATVVIPANGWPREVDLILSAMEAADRDGSGPFPGDALSFPSGLDRRAGRRARQPYRVRAELTLYADAAGAPPRALFTRDADPRGLGFITPHLLPLGYGGWVTLLGPDGTPVRVECTVYRCRRAVQSWHEGALRFHRAAWQFE